MKKNLLLAIFGIIIFSCSSSKTRYFDDNNVEISRSRFKKILSEYKFFEIPGDSTDQKKLISREERGEISNRAILEKKLQEQINYTIDDSQPLVIIYYPETKPCNSTKSTEWIRRWYGELEEGLRQIVNIKPVYIYKSNEGLHDYNGIIKWNEDPKGRVERLFFEHHYPCESFVVISKDGDYISYFGEFAKE
ncbi:MAG: hypothetical protein ACTHY4_05915 [Flavobacteriaceae bacterium]|nr:hypothetical protein [Psychroflexus sp.]